LKGQIQLIDRSVSLATITVTLDPESPEPSVTQEGWDPLRVARDALRGLVSTLQGLVNLAIYLLIYVAPVLLIIALPFWGLWKLWKRSRKPKAPPAPKA